MTPSKLPNHVVTPIEEISYFHKVVTPWKNTRTREEVWGTSITITTAPQNTFPSENTWSLLGWLPLENTGCDDNRIFQLNINSINISSDPRTWKRYCNQDPNSSPCNFPDWKALCHWKQASLLCTLRISEATDDTGGFHPRSKNMKSQRWNWQETEQIEEIVIWCFYLLYISFLLGETGEGYLQKQIFLKNGYQDNDLIFKRKLKNIKKFWKYPFYNQIKRSKCLLAFINIESPLAQKKS